MPMMSLGMFVFDLSTTPYQDNHRQTGWKHPASSRVGDRPARQFVGQDDDTRTLNGVLYPEITGGQIALNKLEDMANAGTAYPLLDGAGNVLGNWVIESLSQTGKELLDNGMARKIEFALTLKRVDDSPAAGASSGSSGSGTWMDWFL